MPVQTNITNFDPASGQTETLLVSDHQRGAADYFDDFPQDGTAFPRCCGPNAAQPDPSITTLAPNTASAAAGAVTVTVTGTNFVSGSKIEIDQAEVATTYVSATSLTTSYDPATAGVKQFTVRNPNDEESNSVAFTVTA